MKVKKIFFYRGIELKIVEVEEPYLNTTTTLTRVVAPNRATLPITFNRKETLKSIQEKTKETLDGFERRGADVIKTLTGAEEITTEDLILQIQGLESELREVKSNLEDAIYEQKEAEKTVKELDEQVESLEDLVPKIKTMDDQTKHELYLENFNKFTVYQFENFLKMIEFL